MSERQQKTRTNNNREHEELREYRENPNCIKNRVNVLENGNDRLSHVQEIIDPLPKSTGIVDECSYL